MKKTKDSQLTTSEVDYRIPKQNNRRIDKFTLAALALAVICCVLVGGTTAKAQDTVVKEVGRAHLAPTEGIDSPGKVTWFLDSNGTRTANVRCTIETELTNSSSELLFRLTDTGGLSGDPACKLRLVAPPLKNDYKFESVSISTFHCGNPNCTATVVSSVDKGSNLFGMNVKGGMKGVFVGFAARKSIFRVRVMVKGPANLSPF